MIISLMNSFHVRFRKIIPALLTMLLFAMTSAASAQQSFKTAEDAAAALANAVKSGEQKAVLNVLGKNAQDIVSSGDEVADAALRQRFVAAYDAKHSVAMQGNSKAVMVIGQEDFPLPIPLVRKNEAWQFDTAAGRLEILHRRIGRNELYAIQSCLAFVDSQNEYAEKDRTGAGVGTYARRFVSAPGKKDGLYWPGAQSEDASPLGELVAQATSEGYRVGGGPLPFHGYYYKILTRQGANAPGGALNYIVNGKLMGGFALVAYPAGYRNSGVMTFLVSHRGEVFQKDLGPSTYRVARGMTSFNPDQSWKKTTDVAPLR